MTEAALIVLMETHLKEKVRCQYIARQLNAKEGPGGTVRRTGTVQELHASILRVARAKFSEARFVSELARLIKELPAPEVRDDAWPEGITEEKDGFSACQ